MMAPPPPPPPGMYPQIPPMMMAPPPPPKQSGRGFTKGIFVTLATTIFGLSLAMNLYLLILSGVVGGMSATNTATLHDGDPTQKIAVIPVTGMILDEAAEKFDRFMRIAEKDANVKAIVVEVDSPGGAVTASDEIFHRIQVYKQNKPTIPVVISMGGLATSGGYYLACAGDHILAQQSTMTGNIGVLMPRFNVHELFDKWGIEETTIQSTGANFKNAGSMFKPEDPQETAYIQSIADEAFTQFKNAVVKGRGSKLTQPIDQIANGKVYMANEAKSLGLIDQIGYPEDAFAWAAKKAGLTKQMVVRYQDPPSFMELFSAKSSVPGAGVSSNAGVTINGVNVNLDLKSLTELTTPRLMYLWRGE